MTDNIFFLGLITRCKDEFLIKEFCDYYLSQGVDKIYVIDDDSLDKSIYDNIDSNSVEIIYEKNIIETRFTRGFYEKVKDEFQWLIYCDTDEFITTKRNSSNTIRDELKTTFKDVDCIKVPWVMMSCNSREKNPDSVLIENTYRWNHDNRHPHKVHKLRCRYEQIEIKCIFKTSKFNSIQNDHFPNSDLSDIIVVDGVNNEPSKLDGFYNNLRETDIKYGLLLCYHYRIVSKEHAYHKILRDNGFVSAVKWYTDLELDELISCDYPEIVDETLKNKTHGK